jgi:hypothetical protein
MDARVVTREMWSMPPAVAHAARTQRAFGDRTEARRACDDGG